VTAAISGRGSAAPARRVGARQEALAGYALIAVPMLLFLVLNIGSILYAGFISVWRWNIRTGPVRFVGLDNNVHALTDPIFRSAVTNTLYYTVIWVPRPRPSKIQRCSSVAEKMITKRTTPMAAA
jgi:hypothetical protein